MKKIFASLTIFAAMLAGCQKPELDAPAGVREAYTATVEAFGAQTKTSLAPNNQIIWTADDRLAVFQASTIADEYKLVEGCEGLTNASFKIVAEDVTLNGDFVAGTEIPCNVAVYPYSENLVLSVVKGEDEKQFNISNIVLPQTQTYAENSFSNGAFMMAAVTETFKDHNLKFKNVMGAVKFQFKGDKTVKTVAIKGNNGELLSGAAVVTVNENNLNPTITMAPDAMNEVVLDCAEGVQLNETEATDFVIALPPVKFEAGFTVTVTDSEGSVNTITSDNPRNAVLRSAILVMPVMTLGEGTVVPEPEPESENWSLITSMDEWTEDIPLEYDGTFYYAKGLELEGYVKFRRDADWEVNFGSVSLAMNLGLLAANDAIVPLAYNGMDICLEKNTYDVYLDLENARAWFMTAGSVPTPVSYEWGIVGEVNAWGERGENDIPMVATDTKGLFVAKNIEMPDGGFKIRANSKWEDDANYGLNATGNLTPDYYYRLSSSGNTGDMLLVAGTYDIWFDLFNAMVYVMSPGKDISDALFGEPVAPAPGPEPDPNVPVLTGWAVAGKFNSWDTSANPMTKEGAYYVLKGVKGLNPVEGSDDFGFKFVVNGTDWKGSVGEVAAGAWEYVWDKDNGSNIYVKDATADAAYDIYVNPSEGDNGKFVVVPAGTPMPEDGSLTPDVPETPGVEGEASQWGIVGDVNGWGASSDILMYKTATEGLFVAKDVEMIEGAFKIRANNEWNDAANYGLEIADVVEVDHAYDLICAGNSKDMSLAAGMYDIWFDFTNSKVYIMSPGKDISEAVAGSVQTPPAPTDVTWYLVGSFNSWNPKDDAYKMVVEGDWFVYKNLTLAADAEVKVCDGTWDVNRGGSFAGVGTACSVAQGGSNIMITTAGTYDIYLNSAANKLYFMTAGETPAN